MPGEPEPNQPHVFCPRFCVPGSALRVPGARAGQWGGRGSPRNPEGEQTGRGLSTSYTSVLGEAIWRGSVMVEAGTTPTGAVATPCPKELPLAPKY